MNQGEIVFYLREITSHWAGSNVSPEKLAELEAASLIEINRAENIAVRLTTEGHRCKESFRRRHSAPNGISLTDPASARHNGKHPKNVPRSKRRFQEANLR